MGALAVSEDAATLPVLRPLIGMDKEEIVTVARRIGTLDTSILPYEDCCTVFTPRHPRLRPLPGEIQAAEEKLLEYQLFRVPIVRNGKQATVGYCPDVWQTWE